MGHKETQNYQNTGKNLVFKVTADGQVDTEPIRYF